MQGWSGKPQKVRATLASYNYLELRQMLAPARITGKTTLKSQCSGEPNS